MRTAALLFALFTAGCALSLHRPLPAWTDAMSDGCSVPSPFRPLFTFTESQRACCVRHDSHYYVGGSVDDRLSADRGLRACEITAGLSPTDADLMFWAVRAGGGPEGRYSYSWAFGGKRFVYSDKPARTR